MIRRTRGLRAEAFFAALLFTLFAYHAATAQPRMPSAKDRAANLKERLSLTDSQTVAITKILEGSQQEMRKAFSPSEGNRDSMRAMRMSLMKKTDDRIDSLLFAGPVLALFVAAIP